MHLNYAFISINEVHNDDWPFEKLKVFNWTIISVMMP